MPWLLVIAVLFLSWPTARCRDVETVYSDETSPADDVGFWPVFDTFSSRSADDNKTKVNGGQDHPSCLLLKMKFVVSMGNKTIFDIPRTAQINNDTCYLPEDYHYNDESQTDYTFTPQSAVLSWIDNDGVNSSLAMTFASGPKGLGNQGYDQWFWMAKLALKTPSVTLKLKNMRLFSSPLLFAFRCKGQAVSLKTVAKVNGTKEDVVLTFHHLEVEPFRANRYYESLTHLKWDCHNGWPYSYVPVIILLVIALVVIVAVSDMYMGYRRWKQNNSSQEATENLVAAESDDSSDSRL